MAYSFAQLEGLWEQAGGSHALAPVMAAIALAESRGDPNATGPVGEKGLWQINPHTWGSLATYDPLGNARAAVHVAASPKGLGNWTTYSSGAYKHFLGSAKPVIPKGSTGTGQAPGTTTAGGRGSGTGSNIPTGDSGGSTSSGGLGGWFHSIWLGLQAGLGVSASTGNEPAQAIEGTVHAASDLGAIADAIAGLTLPFVVMARAIDWFFVPSHWIRIMAGIGGGVLVGFGGYELTQTGDKPAALPMGIASVGVGGVLLFVAFHNLDPKIKTVGELLSDLQSKVQSPGSTSPAAAVTAAGGG